MFGLFDKEFKEQIARRDELIAKLTEALKRANDELQEWGRLSTEATALMKDLNDRAAKLTDEVNALRGENAALKAKLSLRTLS